MANFDIKKLTTEEKVFSGAAVVTLICLFLPWESGSFGPYSASENAFHSGYIIGAFLLILAGVYLVLRSAEVSMPDMPVTPNVILLGASGLGTLLIIIRILTAKSGSGRGYSYGPGFGLYITLIAGLAEVVCAVMLFRKSGEKLPWDKTASSTPTPPPPVSQPPTV